MPHVDHMHINMTNKAEQSLGHDSHMLNLWVLIPLWMETKLIHYYTCTCRWPGPSAASALTTKSLPFSEVSLAINDFEYDFADLTSTKIITISIKMANWISNNLKVLWVLSYFALIVSLPDWAAFNSLWPSDAIWWHRSAGLTMAWVMACCLTAPCHYLN